MDVRITPYSRLVPLSKYHPKTNSVYSRNHPSSLNTSNNDSSNRILLLKSKTRLDRPHYLNPPKNIRSNNNNLLLITRKNSKPQFSLNMSPNMIQPANSVQTSSVAGNKKVLLYQQIERNKLSLGGAELINRFNYRV